MMHLIWLVPVFPLIGVILNGLWGRTRLREKAHLVAVPAAGLSCLAAFLISLQVFAGKTLDLDLSPWVVAGDFQVPIGFRVDPLSAVMMLTVTFVGFLIHVYSVRYMAGDPGYPRYFTYLNLFLFAMLLLVLANNYLLLFLGWEGVGVCSYLLIGFWYERRSAGDAANKAFLVNRVGDAGFLLGLFLLWTTFGSLKYAEIFPRAGEVLGAGSPLATVITLALFIGAVGKSAQLPLSVWLPDAMEGPTPTSALIHAATMVTAGVYLVTRSSPLFSLAPDTSSLVAVVGALTAVFAATIGCVQNNIKQVLAYSTITQLGFMFLAAGLGAYTTAIFHLVTHACFKSLLFLGAGSVIQALHGEHDIQRMGGLAPHMRVTAYAFLIGALATAGMFPLAGYWSQSQIFFAAFNGGRYFVWVLGLSAAFLTAFYVFRLYLVTFAGPFRGNPHHLHRLRKAPADMWIPLAVLALLSVGVGFVGVTPEHGILHGFLGQSLSPGAGQEARGPFGSPLALLPLGVASAAIGLAYLSYAQWWELSDRFRTPYMVLFRRYFLDEIYSAVFLDGFRRCCRVLWRMDGRVIDGAVHKVAGLVLGSSATCSRLDGAVIDRAVNATASVVVGSGAIATKLDEAVLDGAVNAVGDVVVGSSTISWKVDDTVLDGAVNKAADMIRGSSNLGRRLQTGVVQNYMLAMAWGILLVALYLLFR